MKRLNSLTLKQLRALDAVARHGSITHAADELGLTAPAVHSQLGTLEANFGCAMLQRGRAGAFAPTEEGRALLRAHEKAQNALAMAIYRIEALQRGLAGSVVLGVVSTGKYFAPGLVARLRRAYPDIEIVLRIGNRDAVIKALQDGAIDLAIMGRPPRDPPVESRPLGDHPHLLIAPPDHPLLRAQTIRPADILAQTFLVREPGSGTRILANRWLDRIGEGRPFDATEMESNETIKQAVMAGLGIALISYHTVTEELRSGRLAAIPAEGLPILRHWFLLHRQDLDLTPAIANVRAFIDAQQGDYLPRLPELP